METLVALLCLIAASALATGAGAALSAFPPCLADSVFNATPGESPLRVVSGDPRLTDDAVRRLDGSGADASLLPRGAVFHGTARGSVILELQRWGTQHITTYIASILLQERLGYRVALLQPPPATETTGTFRRLSFNTSSGTGAAPADAADAAVNTVHASLEVWPRTKQNEMEKHRGGFE